MLLARIIALTGTILMGTGILYAFTQGNFSGEGALLLDMHEQGLRAGAAGVPRPLADAPTEPLLDTPPPWWRRLRS